MEIPYEHDIERANLKIRRLNDQLTRLQQYSREDDETISKLLKEKTALRDQINSLKSQLDSSGSSQQLPEEFKQIKDDYHQALAEVAICKEIIAKCSKLFDLIAAKAEVVEALEVHHRKIDGSTSNQLRPTELDSRIAKFVSLICNVSMMKQQMLEIGYNAEKLPLGKLSKSTILKGYDVLRRISEALAQSNQKKCEELSGEFYTVIPHNFGFKKMCEFFIDTPGKLKAKLEMVESLAEIEIATKILKDNVEAEDDPLNSQYKRLQCELSPIEVDTQEFSMIKRYLLNSHAKTHSGYTVDIVQIFKVSRKDELERFKKYSSTKNRMLLWHGSRLTNWTGILSQGLRIAPPEAPVTGYMFGKGVYFADMFSKSADDCYASTQSREGVLLLCEVALGDTAELLSANYNADQLPEGKLSTKGVGFTAPNMLDSLILEDGVIVPLGTPEKQNCIQSSLLYNEYIVYNVEQIRMQYVIQVQFNFEH